MLGDSVVWGEYVRPDGTLSHFLNRQSGQSDRFVNCGVNGLFPLALEGLVEYYGGILRNRKLIVHCNLLWMSSPKADLSTPKEENFNHAQLVPQFFPRIPCYRADTADRLSAVAGRNVELVRLGGPSARRLLRPAEHPALDARRGRRHSAAPPERLAQPAGADHADRARRSAATIRSEARPARGTNRGPSAAQRRPASIGSIWTPRVQWRAFRTMIGLLRDRGNDVLVILGPFNEHMVAEEQRPAFRKLCDGVEAWLSASAVAHVTPETLPSNLYADASHPLTDGYALAAQRIRQDAAFQKWLCGQAR